jgi:hypothetical protein
LLNRSGIFVSAMKASPTRLPMRAPKAPTFFRSRGFVANAATVSTARTLWTPAVNNNGEFGHWDYLKIRDPWDTKNEIRTALSRKRV